MKGPTLCCSCHWTCSSSPNQLDYWTNQQSHRSLFDSVRSYLNPAVSVPSQSPRSTCLWASCPRYHHRRAWTSDWATRCGSVDCCCSLLPRSWLGRRRARAPGMMKLSCLRLGWLLPFDYPMTHFYACYLNHNCQRGKYCRKALGCCWSLECFLFAGYPDHCFSGRHRRTQGEYLSCFGHHLHLQNRSCALSFYLMCGNFSI